MLGVEFDTAERAEAVQWACFEAGLLVLECGRTSVRMSPALTVSEDEMTTALRIFGEAVDRVVAQAPRCRPSSRPPGERLVQGRHHARRRRGPRP